MSEKIQIIGWSQLACGWLAEAETHIYKTTGVRPTIAVRQSRVRLDVQIDGSDVWSVIEFVSKRAHELGKTITIKRIGRGEYEQR